MGNPAITSGYFALCYGALTLAACLLGVAGGCFHRENPKCCTGRNNDCWDFTRRRAVCYCDAYCEKTGDCCEDYHTVCQISAIDCIVGPWGPWTECSSLCGIGSRDRGRLVTIPPRNGGTPCPDLKQRRGCYGHNPERCHSVKEVAKILPDSYKRNFKDPWKRPHMMAKEQKPSYCAYFRMKEVSPSCRLGLQISYLFREKYICVECQGEAMGIRDRCEGDGLEGTRTFWTAASIPGCQGSWVRESLRENCHCAPQSLIFV
ncbi:somatomedin-B and thrombospondin type-1 domain-containing protein [Carcharodon carcharias]|uniref:somatomedin-B and thrombospondin type-1 domain-containing protein n=1 Tax=Carcharodon carcharias TaxID=13397 RepID=UPI001B7E256B|nr:somatomedin-B and thrombospondin type-1 domain-containing protein [Carcharodon carcharias]